MASDPFQRRMSDQLHLDSIAPQLSETIPLINTEGNTIPVPPPLPCSITTITEVNKSSSKLFNNFLHLSKSNSSSMDLRRRLGAPMSLTKSNNSLPVRYDVEGENFSAHTSANDLNSLGRTNRFLHELRVKRSEFHNRSRNLSIDQRIAMNRCRRTRSLPPVRDVYDVNFAENDNIHPQEDVFDEDAQEKIREKIFHELDRQRAKQLKKQHRHLMVGRALLIFTTSLIILMSFTLVYVVSRSYNRVKYFDATTSDQEFIPMVFDATVAD